ncbi:MAG: SDR family NAD(P)-dependent oxidoreductase [candidate division Zixibacteria bacterium]|nr:SDR family NAD(P)-dependent oxidoreductase [candidate division Zixibacteria bacterium]
MPLLKDTIALVTGASSGIGRACAEVLAREGADLLICARREDRVKKLAKELTDRYGVEIHAFALDVRNQKEVEKTLTALPEKWKAIDILVNNAGLSRGLDKLHEGLLSDWEEMIDTNVKGLLYVSRVVIPWMVARKKGDVVNIGSIAGHEVYPGGNVYCATKFGVDAITKGMQIDLVDTPIRVSTVDPGMVETEFSIVRFHGDTGRAGKVYEGITPLSGADVAEAVLFCVTRPPHVNIHQVRIMPTNQAAAMVAYRAPK